MQSKTQTIKGPFLAKTITFLYLMFFAHQQMYGQDLGSTSIISYEDKLAYGIDFSTDIDEFFINNPDDGVNAHLVSNNDLKLTVRFNYKFLNLSASFAPEFLPGNDDDEERGKSSFQNYQANLFPGRFVQNVFFRRMKGFYVENTQDFLPTWTGGDPYLQFPDLKSITWGGGTGFILNKDFSLRSILNRQEWQLESKGSFIPSVQYEFTKFTNTFAFEEGNAYGKENVVDLRADIGYYYNLVVTPNVNIVPSVRGGIGPKFSKYTLQGEVEKNNYFVTEYGAGLRVGYNTDKLYLGVIGELNGTSYDDDDDNISNNLWHGAFYIGYRFEAPERLKRIF
ncbi:DUF4421 domain-containing protein [Flagellimonas marinaquae]|uniref:DUF4421 family protein n=1 Tax=Flagellimonas aurea TaxID=2915619 RepID=UPI001CE22132|nr:DUF4421 domain-containing protein [Allomuricauda aquimarina]